MGWECGKNGREERCIEGFDGEVKVKIKITLVPFNNAQRGSRGTDILFP